MGTIAHRAHGPYAHDYFKKPRRGAKRQRFSSSHAQEQQKRDLEKTANASVKNQRSELRFCFGPVAAIARLRLCG